MLRQHKLGEADRIVTLLTPRPRLGSRGRRGRSPHRSKFGSPAGALRAHRRPTASRPQSRHRHPGGLHRRLRHRHRQRLRALHLRLRGPGDRRAAGRREHARSRHLHRLTVGALRAVADAKRPRELVLDATCCAPWASPVGAVADRMRAVCGAGPHRAFHIAAGGSVCMHCRPSGSTTPPQAVVDLMSALHDGDWEAAEASSPSHRSHASGLVAAHLQWHLERCQLRPAAGGAGLPAAHRPR